MKASVTTTYINAGLLEGYSIRVRHHTEKNVTDYMPLHNGQPLASRPYKTEAFARMTINHRIQSAQ